MRTGKKSILLIVPSAIVAKGLEQIFSDQGEFTVTGNLQDLSCGALSRIRSFDADILLVDPSVFDVEARRHARNLIAEYTDIPVVALLTSLQGEDSLRQYDAVIDLYETPSNIIFKIRATLESARDVSRSEGEELSAREKDILICVAKGMLNKEIADLYNISIYTVITHRKNITRKTGIKTVAGLTVYALLNNLIDINSVE